MVDQLLTLWHAMPDVPMAKAPEFWHHFTTQWFIELEAQFKVNRITRLGQRLVNVAQCPMDGVAIEVSCVLSVALKVHDL